MSFQKTLSALDYSPDNARYGHRCYTLETAGTIKYDPPRPKNSPYWCVAEVDKGITAYYRSLFEKFFKVPLYAPAFDAHVSILRGMPTPRMDTHWGYLDNTDVVIQYDHRIWYNEQHVWINTYFPEYFKIREYYEVPKWNETLFGHMTIGKFTP